MILSKVERHFSSSLTFTMTSICSVCGFLGKDKKAMTKHEEIHDDRRFQCDVCKKIVVGAKALRNHTMTHNLAECIYEEGIQL